VTVANYPPFGQRVSAQDEALDDLTIDRATVGTGYGRAFYTAEIPHFNFQHILSEADAGTLKAFYAANKKIPFAFTFEGDDITYPSMLFEKRPSYSYLGGGWVEVDVTLVAV
jgi:hypothetical protein